MLIKHKYLRYKASMHNKKKRVAEATLRRAQLNKRSPMLRCSEIAWLTTISEHFPLVDYAILYVTNQCRSSCNKILTGTQISNQLLLDTHEEL